MTDDLFGDISEFLETTKDNLEVIPISDLQPLTNVEVESLIMSFMEQRGDEGADEEETYQLVKWAERIRIQQTLLEMVFAGEMGINWEDDEATFTITDTGTEIFRDMAS